MRRTPNALWPKLPAVVAGLLVTWVCSASAIAQPPPVHLPTAIISSGGSGLEPASGTTDALQSDSSSPWTADRNPVSPQLRPNANPAYPPLPGSDSSVVSAAAQTPVSSERASDRQSSAAAHSVSLATSPEDHALDDAKHMPMEPPSERFKGEAPAAASSTLQTIFSVGSSLLVVVGLFLGVAWCYRRTLNPAVSGGLPKQVVQVMGRTSISARQQMVLVRFGSKLLLVSVIQGEARTLSEITDPLEVDQMVGLCESGRPGSISSSFQSVLLQEGNR